MGERLSNEANQHYSSPKVNAIKASILHCHQLEPLVRQQMDTDFLLRSDTVGGCRLIER